METSCIFASFFFLIHPQRGFGATISTMWDETQKNSRIMAQHTVTVRMQEHLDHCVSGLRSIPMEGWFMVGVTSSFLFWTILEYFGVLILQDSLIFVVFWLVYWFIWDNSVTPVTWMLRGRLVSRHWLEQHEVQRVTRELKTVPEEQKRRPLSPPSWSARFIRLYMATTNWQPVWLRVSQRELSWDCRWLEVDFPSGKRLHSYWKWP